MPTSHEYLKAECNRYFCEVTSALAQLITSLAEHDDPQWGKHRHMVDHVYLVWSEFREVFGNPQEKLPEDFSDLRGPEKSGTKVVLRKSGEDADTVLGTGVYTT